MEVSMKLFSSFWSHFPSLSLIYIFNTFDESEWEWMNEWMNKWLYVCMYVCMYVSRPHSLWRMLMPKEQLNTRGYNTTDLLSCLWVTSWGRWQHKYYYGPFYDRHMPDFVTVGLNRLWYLSFGLHNFGRTSLSRPCRLYHHLIFSFNPSLWQSVFLSNVWLFFPSDVQIRLPVGEMSLN
jgi:hypothetical protein